MADHQKTIPWSDEEFITINGQQLAYHLVKDDMMIHFGAGEKALLSEIDHVKNKISMPKRKRSSAFD